MDVVTRPRDLPELRLSLLDEWHGPFAVHANAGNPDPRFADDGRFAHLESAAEIHFLREAELWWITPEMSRLVAHAAESLPPTTLTEDLIPRDKTVLAFFAEPLLGDDAVAEDHQMSVRALLWFTSKIIWDPTNTYVSVSIYNDCPFPDADGLLPPYLPVGRTDWCYGVDTEEPSFEARPDNEDARRIASMAQDRRWLAALNLLAAQPLAQRTIERQTNKAKIRKYKRTGLPSDVRLVGLRTTPSGEPEPGEPRKVNWSHRWIVGQETGGFWKQQAYGPRWSLHRPIWIMPFEKGPKNKPLVIKDTVHVVRGD